MEEYKLPGRAIFVGETLASHYLFQSTEATTQHFSEWNIEVTIELAVDYWIHQTEKKKTHFCFTKCF